MTAAIEETRFLVEAVAATPLLDNAKPRRRPIEDRVVWVIELFERLERRDQLQRTASYR
jgi:phytoene synthase